VFYVQANSGGKKVHRHRMKRMQQAWGMRGKRQTQCRPVPHAHRCSFHEKRSTKRCVESEGGNSTTAYGIAFLPSQPSTSRHHIVQNIRFHFRMPAQASINSTARLLPVSVSDAAAASSSARFCSPFRFRLIYAAA